MVKISVVIITHNEERLIAKCIDSVRPVADEILVVDSYSTDRTRDICLSHGVNELWTADRDFSRFPELKTHNPLTA